MGDDFLNAIIETTSWIFEAQFSSRVGKGLTGKSCSHDVCILAEVFEINHVDVTLNITVMVLSVNGLTCWFNFRYEHWLDTQFQISRRCRYTKVETADTGEQIDQLDIFFRMNLIPRHIWLVID